MAKRIPKTFIDELISRTDIVGLIGSKIAFAKKTGDNQMACCPFHNEKTPSFAVSQSKQFYHCFGCGVGGDALRFLMDYDHLTFVEAVESLADFNGMTVPYEEVGQAVDMEEVSRMEEGLSCLQAAADFFQATLYGDLGRDARGYLRGRGLKKSTIDRYQIGYAPRDNRLLSAMSAQYPLELLQAVGLVGEKDGRHYDWFRDRVMFPIRNIRGQVIAFGARALGEAQPKYLNSGESAWFNKRRELYGLDSAVHSVNKSLIVTEGYMDVVTMAQFGIDNAVAALGTALGEAHITQLKKRSRKVYFCFDGDQAGFGAAEKALHEVFAHHDDEHSWRFVFMPEGEDPDSLLFRQGKEAFYQQLDGSLTPSQFLQHLLKLDDREHWTVEERAQAAQLASQWLGELPEGHYRRFLQNELQKRLSTQVEIDPHLPQTSETNTYPSRAANAGTVMRAPQKAEWRLLALLFAYPYWQQKVDLMASGPVLTEKMPWLYEALYLLRCGAEKTELEAWLNRNGVMMEVRQASHLLEELEEAALQQEFCDSIAQMMARAQEQAARLEKLGG